VLPEQRRLRIPTPRQLDEIRLQKIRCLQLSSRYTLSGPSQGSDRVEESAANAIARLRE
jgi:hypothetical protein